MESLGIFLVILLAHDLHLTIGQEFNTTHGMVRGNRLNINGRLLDVFYGIPFAKPPVGDLRFKHPHPAEAWSPEVKDATKETPSCMQSKMLYAMFPEDSRPPDDYSEDCLHLNIWKPANPGTKLAVMVWIYGGGFSIGTARTPTYNGQYLAAEYDVIVVTFNYRVGPLGFAYLGPGTVPGNMGLMDQVMALKWVKENIENFGGDSNRITIFGESAGSMSIGHHLLSDLSRDFFNNAILQSGAPVYSISDDFMLLSKDHANDNLKKVAQTMQCSHSSDADVYECLMKAKAEGIITASEQLSFSNVNFFPMKDGYFIREDPMNQLERGQYKKTNILQGVTKDEGTLFFTFLLDVNTKKLLTSGERFGLKHIDSALSMLLLLKDKNLKQALEVFYVSEHSPTEDPVEVLNQISSDVTFRCPSHKFSSVYSETGDVYFYSYDYRHSLITEPEWMGVTHGSELGLTFGLPLNDSLGFSQDDKTVSRKMMTYWTNFAKTGNPNTPISVSDNWPTFDTVNQRYITLSSNVATADGFRRHQCAFVNDILPMVARDDAVKWTTTAPYACPSGSRRQFQDPVLILLGFVLFRATYFFN